MAISIAILGASGSVGTVLGAHLLRSGLLEPQDRLQLVGRGNPRSDARLLATRIDLLDAFDDSRVEVEVVPQIADLDADIVVIAAGVGISPQCTNRRDMGAMNLDLFYEIAEQCAALVPDSLFIVVSNPVELAVQILCQKLDRKRVVGMGAQQDSLRFARAIAKDVGVSRHQVRATVLGEHGLGMVPIWSSVELTTPQKEADAALQTLRRTSEQIDLRERVAFLQRSVVDCWRKRRSQKPMKLLVRLSPMRAFLSNHLLPRIACIPPQMRPQMRPCTSSRQHSSMTAVVSTGR